jgi:hypothetical protein
MQTHVIIVHGICHASCMPSNAVGGLPVARAIDVADVAHAAVSAAVPATATDQCRRDMLAVAQDYRDCMAYRSLTCRNIKGLKNKAVSPNTRPDLQHKVLTCLTCPQICPGAVF